MAQPTSDRLASTDAAEALNFLSVDTAEKTSNPNMLNSQDAIPIGPRRDIVDQLPSLGSVEYHKSGYVANACSTQAPPLYNASYYSAADKQGTYIPYVNDEALGNGSHGIQNEYPSVAFHGYEYSPQVVHKPCVPVTTQLFAREHGHLYDARQFSTYDPFCFQKAISPNSSSILSPTPVSQAKLPVHIDLQGNSQVSGLRPNCSHQQSSGRGGNFFGNSGELGLLHQGFEGSEVGGLWSDWSIPSEGKGYMLQLSSPATSLKPIGSLEVSRDDFELASQQKGSFYGFGSCSGSSYTSYSHHQSDQAADYGSVSTSGVGMDGQSWPTLDEVRHGGRYNNFSCSNVTLDMLSERNRGPRAFKPKIRTILNGSAVDNSKNGIIDEILRHSYNRLDFVTKYKDVKFFIIKSYSEDNVHKSIKYGVWASTPNGNKKLDFAYREAKEKQGTCPIFLFFSVNASAQFCGVAEMVGPVDFEKNVDYWLPDKWSGQFPVKWHIIKDVPNSQFRHILLENNDNKPVTNSRDTQEVEMEQGIEILKIFKNYETYSSILDDFYFYEQRQKALQERKAGQQASLVAPPAIVVSDQQIPVSLSTDYIKKMCKSFAEAVSLTKHENEHSAVGKVVSSTTVSVAYGS